MELSKFYSGFGWWPLYWGRSHYLTHKAKQVGYNAEVILSGRRVNDSMAEHIAMLVKAISKNNKTIYGAKILILGLTFKENCPDIRNTKVIDIYTALKDLGLV